MILRRISILIVAVAACFHAAAPLRAQSPALVPAPAASPTPTENKPMTAPQHAKGTFEVKLAPQPLADADAGDKLSRMSIDKQFSGDLTGVSKGEMLSAMGEVKGSAGYVAMERVTGTLNGRKGSFVLQHSATMNRGVPQMNIAVVPDSGTEELTGLAGTFKIDIAEGKHSYTFDYTLPQ